MATYKLVLTVKDSSGKEKEIDGGTVNIDLTNLTPAEVTTITEALNLDTYTTDQELAETIKEVPTVEIIKETIKTDIPTVLETQILFGGDSNPSDDI